MSVNLDLIGLEIKKQVDSLSFDLYNELKKECETYDQIDEKIKKNGKTVLVSGRRVYIKPVHLLDYIDMTEKQIHEYAKMEREKAAMSSSS